MPYRNPLIIGIALICIVGFLFFRFRPENPNIERVEYVTHRGNDPSDVVLTFSAPTTDLSAVPETIVTKEFFPDDLLSLQGVIAVDPKKEPLMPLIVKFVEHTDRGDVTGNSAGLGPPYDPKVFEILINCPRKPATYFLDITWGGGHNYIARAKIIVRPR